MAGKGLYLRDIDGTVIDVRAAGIGTALVILLGAFAITPAAAGVAPPPPLPDQGNTYDLYAGAQEQYDGNLYRLPPGVSAATVVSPDAERSDRITTVSAGGDLQRLLGRQAFLIDLHADENRFAHNTALNNTSGYAKLLWDWQVGPYFSGTAGANYSHGLVSFGEALYLGRDLVDSTDYFGTARWQVGPHWAVYGGIDDSGVAHSAVLARTGDFHTKGANAGIEYALDPTDTFGLEYHYDEGRFPPGQVYTLGPYTFSPDFHDDKVLFVVKHSFSDKTQLTADVGYQKRFYPNTVIGSFAGDVWRVTLNWEPTDKTQLAFAAWHELHAYLVSQSNYFVSKGGSITPSWFATEKLSVSMAFSYETQDYIPESSSVVALGPLTSNVAVEQANINYSPRQALTLSLSYIHSKRDSNALSFRYGDDLATFSVLYKTH